MAAGFLAEPMLSLALSHIRDCPFCEGLLALHLSATDPLQVGPWSGAPNGPLETTSPHPQAIAPKPLPEPVHPTVFLLPQDCELRRRKALWEWVGIHTKTHKPCQMLVLRPEFAALEDLTREFLDRIATLSSGGTFLPRILEFGKGEPGPFVILERGKGRPLSLQRGERILETEEVARIGLGVLDSLEELHGANLVHGPLLPGKIHWDPDIQQVLLLDDCLGPNLLNTTLDPRVASFQSPEQAMGHPLQPQADFFSLGCLLYFLLTGNSPWLETGASGRSLTPLDTAQLTGSWRGILRLLLEREPQDRPGHSSDIRGLLSRWALTQSAKPGRTSKIHS